MDFVPADWSSLYRDLLAEIAARIPIIEDFMSFRGVCTSWRVAAGKDKFKPRPIIPLLMKNDGEEREFYSLNKRRICMKISLPEEKGQKCIGVKFGWLLFHSREVHLLNPFTRARIELPEQGIFGGFIARAVLSADPSRTPNFVLMVIAGKRKRLAFWKSGDPTWTEIEVNVRGGFYDIIHYNGLFYGVSYRTSCSIVVWDPYGADPTEAEIMVKADLNAGVGQVVNMYWVESTAGELILISRHGFWDDVTEIGVLRLDVRAQICEEFESLGCDSIFVGRNATISVAAIRSFPDVIKPNCIYFMDDGMWKWYKEECEEGLSMGVYNLEDGSIEPLDIVGESQRSSSSSAQKPIWIEPYF